MSEEKPSVGIVLVPLLMLFISGAWTLASLIPYVRHRAMRETMFCTTTVSNISFLISTLFSMLFYLEMGEKENLKRRITIARAEEGLIQVVAEHAKEVHGVTEITPELEAKVKATIRDE